MSDRLLIQIELKKVIWEKTNTQILNILRGRGEAVEVEVYGLENKLVYQLRVPLREKPIYQIVRVNVDVDDRDKIGLGE